MLIYFYCVLDGRKNKASLLYVYIIVTGPPVIKQPLHKNNVPLKEGSSFNISCRAAGYGSLTYYWEKKDSKEWITVDSNNKTLYEITNTGLYRCNATNEAGSVISPEYNVYGEYITNSRHACSQQSIYSYILYLYICIYNIYIHTYI